MTNRAPARLRISLCGAVQGVGLRPHVFKLALTLGLCGYVRNDGSGVTIEIEGENIDLFRDRLSRDLPKGARIDKLETRSIAPQSETGFRILASVDDGNFTRIGPDVATCPDCLDDLFDPTSRFYRYPFTTCASCGPRFTITRALP